MLHIYTVWIIPTFENKLADRLYSSKIDRIDKIRLVDRTKVLRNIFLPSFVLTQQTVCSIYRRGAVACKAVVKLRKYVALDRHADDSSVFVVAYATKELVIPERMH